MTPARNIPVSSDDSSGHPALLHVAVSCALAGLFYALHPYTYGDGVWYAIDLKRDAPLPVDAGHLLWRPLGLLVWKVLGTLGIAADPLIVFQGLTAIGTAVACSGTYVLARRMTVPPSPALAAACLLGASHVAITYGASGTSYTPAAALVVLAVLFVIPRERDTWSVGAGVASAVALALAWAVWGAAILLPPVVLGAAVLYSRGSILRRIFRAAILGAGAGLLMAALAFTAFLVVAQRNPTIHFGQWFSQSSHGIPMGLSFLSVARAALGFIAGFVYLDSLGSSVKGLLLWDPTIVNIGRSLVPIVALAAFVLAVGLSLLGLLRHGRSIEAPTARGVALAAFAMLPVGAFACLWQGSDLERFSLALPFVSVALVQAAASGAASDPSRASARWPLEWALVAVVAAPNLLALVIPSLLTGGGIHMSFGRTARQVIAPGSILVVSGQDLGPPVARPTMYWWQIDVYNILFKTESGRDVADWDSNLTKAVATALERGGQVAVLSDLLGEPTPGGIGLSQVETPVPTLAQVSGFFAGWRRDQIWKVDRYTFYRVSPPPGWFADRERAARVTTR